MKKIIRFKRITHLFFVLLVSSNSIFAQETDLFKWSFEQYEPFYIDVDGDGAKDLFLHSLKDSVESVWVKGTLDGKGLRFKATNAIKIADNIQGVPWDASQAVVIPGQFNADKLLLFSRLRVVLSLCPVEVTRLYLKLPR